MSDTRVSSSGRAAARRGGAGRGTAEPRRQRSGDTTTEFLLLGGTAALLIVLGLVMTFSASFVESTAETGNAFGIFGRQLLWSVLGLPLLGVIALSDYRKWQRWAPALMVVAAGAALVVLLPGFGVSVNGARRWIDLGPVNFQPSELLKVVLCVYLAAVLASRWSLLRSGDMRALLLPAVPVTIAAAALVMAEPDLETAGLIVAIAGVMLVAAGLPGRIIGFASVVLMLVGAAGIASAGYRRGRFIAWLDPMADPSNYGYQTVQGYLALGSGGINGVGLGQGRGKWLWIPNAHTDYIFAIIGEELGLLGATFVLVLFTLLAVGGIRTARSAPDAFGRLLAVGITAWLLLQAVINIGSVVGLLPVTGVTLPLLSFGGSSLVLTMIGVGLLLSVARHARPPGAKVVA